MNQVWVFFKLIEVVLGALCMSIHMRGAILWPQYVSHVIIYCATFISFTALAALGAFRLLITQKCVLSSQLLLTLGAVIAHYFCGLFVMRDIANINLLSAANNSNEYLEHPAFSICKQQSIASLITGTMYLMHMFHVLDLLMRMEPGDWRRQATFTLIQTFTLDEMAGRTTGLFVLSKPVDDFLCNKCSFYDTLAHSQPMHFRDSAEAKAKFIVRMLSLFGVARSKLCQKDVVDSDESYMSTPTITSSDSSDVPSTPDNWSFEDEAFRNSFDWRGISDSSSLWAQIEDKSSQGNATTSDHSRSTDEKNKVAWEDDELKKSEILLVTQGATRRSIWDEENNDEKSNIWTVKRNSTNPHLRPNSESNDESDEEYHEMDGDRFGNTKGHSEPETAAPFNPLRFDKDSQTTSINEPKKTAKK